MTFRAVRWPVFAVLLILVCCSFDVIKVVRNSMSPTVRDGDNLVVFAPRGILTGVLSIRHILRRNMVVVFRSPATLWPTENGLLVKRIIGLANDRIRIESGVVRRNGLALDEPYVLYPTATFKSGDTWPTGEQDYVVVPEAKIFVLGDNRLESVDSRIFGEIPQSSVAGVVLFVMPRVRLAWPLFRHL